MVAFTYKTIAAAALAHTGVQCMNLPNKTNTKGSGKMKGLSLKTGLKTPENRNDGFYGITPGTCSSNDEEELQSNATASTTCPSDNDAPASVSDSTKTCIPSKEFEKTDKTPKVAHFKEHTKAHMDAAKDKTKATADDAKKVAGEAKEKTKEAADAAAVKTKEAADAAAVAAKKAADKGKRFYQKWSARQRWTVVGVITAIGVAAAAMLTWYAENRDNFCLFWSDASSAVGL